MTALSAQRDGQRVVLAPRVRHRLAASVALDRSGRHSLSGGVACQPAGVPVDAEGKRSPRARRTAKAFAMLGEGRTQR